MTDFRNAYHFVPRQPESERRTALEPNPTLYGMGDAVADGHAAYAPGTRSGRLICTLTLECPTVIGAQRKAGDSSTKSPALVEPFLYRNKPAIPASSLKGMISAIAESASRAPYRVLKNMQLTVAYPPNPKDFKTTLRHWVDKDGRKQGGNGKLVTRMGRSHDYFHPSLLPLALGKTGRSFVHPVETMFGFVRESTEGATNAGRDRVVGVAGKLRFGNALPCGNWAPEKQSIEAYFLSGDTDFLGHTLPETVKLTLLKEQGQPMKPPKRPKAHGKDPDHYEELYSATPNFYFVELALPNEKGERVPLPDKRISKPEFARSDPENYAPQGGKFYLHHPDTERNQWRAAGYTAKGKTTFPSDGIERKAAVAVLKQGITFRFVIDFDNLSEVELGILCFALRPSRKFRHKIGLGKGLGLGSVRVDIDDMVVIDRARRYQKHSLFQADARTGSDGSGRAAAERLAHAHKEWLETADKPALTALLAIGETHTFPDPEEEAPEQAADPVPVLWVPLTAERYAQIGTPEAEQKSFQWFTNNDLGNDPKQKLKPIGADGVIPTLKTTTKTMSPVGGGDAGKPSPAKWTGQQARPAPRDGYETRIQHVNDKSPRGIVAAAAPVHGSNDTLKEWRKGHRIDSGLCRKHGINKLSMNQKVRVWLEDEDPGSDYLPRVSRLEIPD